MLYNVKVYPTSDDCMTEFRIYQKDHQMTDSEFCCIIQQKFIPVFSYKRYKHYKMATDFFS